MNEEEKEIKAKKREKRIIECREIFEEIVKDGGDGGLILVAKNTEDKQAFSIGMMVEDLSDNSVFAILESAVNKASKNACKHDENG